MYDNLHYSIAIVEGGLNTMTSPNQTKRQFKPKVYDDRLPATPVTNNMRSQFEEIARSKKAGLAEIQRQAFALFLSQNYSNAIEETTLATVEAEAS